MRCRPMNAFANALLDSSAAAAPRRAHNRPRFCRKQINDAKAEGQLGANNRQIHRLASRDREQRGRVGDVAGYAAPVGRNARVARRAQHLRYAVLSAELPDHGMFSGTATDNQDFHVDRD